MILRAGSYVGIWKEPCSHREAASHVKEPFCPSIRLGIFKYVTSRLDCQLISCQGCAKDDSDDEMSPEGWRKLSTSVFGSALTMICIRTHRLTNSFMIHLGWNPLIGNNRAHVTPADGYRCGYLAQIHPEGRKGSFEEDEAGKMPK
jgi:hypothetical protein